MADHFVDWQECEAVAEAMIPLIGRLYRDHHVVTSIFGRPIINRSVIDILKAHKFARQIEDNGLSVRETYPVLTVLGGLDLGPARIDIGKLAAGYRTVGAGQSLEEYITEQVAPVSNEHKQALGAGQDVILYGFGRIGRLVARILVERAGSGSGLNLRAIVVRPGAAGNDLQKRASLLRRDSVHGSFNGAISVDEQNQVIYANGVAIQIIYAQSPDTIDYTRYGIKDAVLVDNTGKWRDREGLEQHLHSAGVARVLLTAPGKGDINNIVYGVNHQDIEPGEPILSAASCTTNAITPVLKAINDRFGIEHGHVETVHSYTNDQNLIDNYHKGERRGRSAALNMVITETGAARAVAKALPELTGKLTGNAIRVPTPNVSLAILNLSLVKATTLAELNDFMRATALYSSLQKQVAYVASGEAVSSDFVGNPRAGIVDGKATIVDQADGRRCVLYVWYDNEFGYSCQVNRILQFMTGTMFPSVP